MALSTAWMKILTGGLTRRMRAGLPFEHEGDRSGAAYGAVVPYAGAGCPGAGSGNDRSTVFSINAAYDYQHGDYANGSAGERMALYRRCEAEGVGISVMKPFAGGKLLTRKLSPFGQALTPYQCIQYALDKPGVLTVLPGIRNREDVQELLGFLTHRRRRGIIRFSEALCQRTRREPVFTAITASPVQRDWMWA